MTIEGKWVVEGITWNGIVFLPDATNCEGEVCISCKLSTSSLIGSASIVCLFFILFYQFVSFYLYSSKSVIFIQLDNKQYLLSWLLTTFSNHFEIKFVPLRTYYGFCSVFI